MTDIRKFVLIVTMIVVGASSLLGLWWQFFSPKSGFGPEGDITTVEVEKVRKGSIVKRVNLVGSLDADNEVMIHPEITGKISKVNFTEGAYVKAGDVLVEIEDVSYRAKLKDAEARYQLAQLELERQTSLAAQNAGALKNKQKAQADFLQAEAAVEVAKLELEHCTIKAPFAGYIGLKTFSVGALVDQRTELLTIVDVDPITVDFRVPATYLRSISKGQEVKVTIDSYPDQLFKATVGALDPKVDVNANSVLVRGFIPNPDGKLKPGLFARVNMVVGSKDSALLLPESSVSTSGETSYVWQVVDAKDKTGRELKISIKRPVVTGLSEAGIIEISRGLNEGDDVVTVGTSKVREQGPVRIVEDAEADEAFDAELKDAAEGRDRSDKTEPKADEADAEKSGE